MDESPSPNSRYRVFAAAYGRLPVFMEPWWLDVTAGPNAWDVVLVESRSGIDAALPFAVLGRRGVRVLGMPQLTQTLGPWLSPSIDRSASRLSREKDLIGALLDALPPCDHYAQSWHHSQTNWLPAYWRGYSQTTRYSYRFPSLQDLDAVWASMQSSIRTDVRKAQSRFGVTVDTNATLQEFSRLQDLSFARQGKPPPYSASLLESVDAAAAARGARRILVAKDGSGRPHAGVYIIWDSQSAYYLMGGGDPELRGSGATSLCLWEAIRFSSTVTESFDFEGSMIEPIERFFRAFGAVQTPYFAISRTSSWRLRARSALRGIMPTRRVP